MHAPQRDLTLSLAAFGRECVDREAARHGVPVGTVLQHAALYYLSERASGRAATRIPPFGRREPDASALAAAVSLEPSEWRRLERAAAEEGVTIQALVSHAAMLYVADCDSGQLTPKLLGEQPAPR